MADSRQTLIIGVALATAFVGGIVVLGLESPMRAIGLVLFMVLPTVLGWVWWTLRGASGENEKAKTDARKKKKNDLSGESVDEDGAWDDDLPKRKHEDE